MRLAYRAGFFAMAWLAAACASTTPSRHRAAEPKLEGALRETGFERAAGCDDCPTRVHRYLLVESEIVGSPPPTALLEQVLSSAREKLRGVTGTGRQRAVATLSRVHQALVELGFVPHDQSSLSASLRPTPSDRVAVAKLPPSNRMRERLGNRATVYLGDCDTLSILYLAIAEDNGLPLRLTIGPDHANVAWLLDGGETLFWETTSGEPLGLDAYYKLFRRFSPEEVRRGIYFAPLDERAELALVLNGVGESLLAHDAKRAYEVYSKSAAVFERNPLTYYNRAHACEEGKGGFPCDPLADYAKAIELNPRYADAYINRAYLLRQSKRHDEALRDFGAALAVDGSLAHAYYGRGVVFLEQNRAAEALADLSRAIELRDGYAPALAARADAHHRLGKRREAEADIESATKLEPGNALFRSLAAKIRARKR